MKQLFIFLFASLIAYTSIGQTTYATLNPSDKSASVTLSNGNLDAVANAYTGAAVRSTIGKSSGKWYWEATVQSATADLNVSVGIANSTASLTQYIGSDANGWGLWLYDGSKVNNGSFAAFTGGSAVSDVFGFALDMTAGTLIVYKNGVSQGTMYSGLTGTVFAAYGNLNSYDTKVRFNFGATTFAYSVPGGYSSGLYNSSGNASPTANAGTDQVITLPTSTATLSASGSTDSDGTIASYLWTKISGPTGGTIAASTSVSTGIASLQAGVYVFQVQVTDNGGAVAVDQVQITVNASGNQPPVASAGVDQTITLPTSTTTLSGGGTDPDGTIISYAWSKISGPTGGAIVSASTASTSITGLIAGTYVFRLTVTDNNSATATDDINIIVIAAGSHVKYVSKTGNNTTGDGSIGNPWLTVQKATSTVTTSGDTIHVTAGTYLETSQLVLSIGVSLEGDAAATTIIRSTLTANFTALLDASSGSVTNGNQSISNLTFDGQYVSEANRGTNQGIHISRRNNVEIKNCIITGFYDRGVVFANQEGADLSEPATNCTGNSFHDNTLTNCAAYNTSYGVYGRGCLNIGGQTGMLIYNNTITQTQRAQGYNGWPIKGWNDGWNKGCKIYNNTITKLPFTGTYPGENGWPFAIELFNEHGMEIYGNTIQGSIDANFCTKGTYAYSFWIHDNTIAEPTLTDKEEDGITMEYDAQDMIIEKNTIYNVAKGIMFVPRTGSIISNITIRNNLLYNIGQLGLNGNGGGAIHFYSDLADHTINGFYVYNNTFSAAIGSAPQGGMRFNGSGTTTNLQIKNNIFQNFQQSWLWVWSSNLFSNMAATYNNAYNNGTSNNPYYQAGTPTTSYTYTNNTTNVPGFVGGTDYTLAAGSANIDAGTNVGLPFNGTAPDKGYKETGVPTQNYLQWDALNQYYQQINTNKGIISTASSGYNVLKGTASSVQTISSGESVVFDASVITNFFMVGLSTWKPISKIYDTPVGEDSVQFGVLMALNSTAQAYEAGYLIGSTVSIAANDLIRIQYTGTTINYQKSTNGGINYATFYTSLVPALGRYYVIFHSPSNGAGPNNIYKEGVAVNQPPLVTAGVDLSVDLPVTTANLNGLVSDPDGTISSILWTKVSGPTGGSISTANNDTTVITSLQLGTYVYQLSATDNSGASSSDQVTVVVNAADPNGTTDISPAIIPITSDEVFSNGRGAEQWQDQNYVNLPTEASQTRRKAYYFRWAWYEIETADNVFNWTVFDREINQAIDSGQVFSFGIMCQTTGASWRTGLAAPSASSFNMYYPLYLHNLMQLETANSRDWISTQAGEWVPNYNSPNFITKTKRLYDSIYAHIQSKSYAGVAYKKVIDYFDMRHVGDWGEWHFSRTAPDTTYFPTGRQPTVASLDTLISYMANAMPTFKTVINVSVFDARQIPNTWVSPDVTYFALTKTNTRGPLGWRRDQWGLADNGASYIHSWTDLNVKTSTGMRFDTAIMNRYKYAPILGEPPGQWDNGDVPILKNLPAEIRKYHAVSFGNGNMYTIPQYTPANLSTGTRDSVRLASNIAGWRLQLEANTTMSTQGTSGSVINVNLKWRNAGLTPVYDAYIVKFKVKNSSGTVVITDTSSFRPLLFQPSTTATNYSDQIALPSNLPAGTYSLSMIIEDSLGYRMPLAIANVGRQSDGSYILRPSMSIISGATNQSPTVSISGTTFMQLPVSSDTLTAGATDPDGTISSYAWTKISGTGGTIVSPSAASTRITGLTAGTYVYQVMVTDNGGATAISSITITVASANVSPIANAGGNVLVRLPTASTTLSGTGTDSDGTIASYGWTKISGPTGGTITSPSAASTSITGLVAGSYVYRLTVTDNQGATGTNDATITVTAAGGPKKRIFVKVN